jgi:small subunit ribosomal protein S20
MANHASALKRNRQIQRRRLVNQMNRQKLRTQIKRLKVVISEGKGDEARSMLAKTCSLIDKSVQKGVIKANTARRYKSRISRQVNITSA